MGLVSEEFSNHLYQSLISLLFVLRAGLLGSLRDHRDGCRMFACRFGQIEVVCAVKPAVLGVILPSLRVRAGRIRV